MGNGNNDKRGNQQGKKDSTIYDNDNTVEYSGSWTKNTFIITSQSNVQTSHSTAEPNASIFIPFNAPFNGSTLRVLGAIPPGNGEITAVYTIDGIQPNTRTVPTITDPTPQFFQQFYTSSLLEEGPHNLSISVSETGKGRNYTFELVHVFLDDSNGAGTGNQTKTGQGGANNANSQGGTNSAAIVGGVLGSVILLLAFFAAFIFWRWRLARTRNSRDQHLPPMMYYTRRASDGMQGEKGMYEFDQEVSVIDTNSRYTFRRDAQNDPRRTWVTFSPPPSIPDSALVTDRPISSWSSYKDSSVTARQSHPAIDGSRFSLATPTTISSLAFAERTLTPASSRRAAPMSRPAMPMWQPRLGQMYNSRRL